MLHILVNSTSVCGKISSKVKFDAAVSDAASWPNNDYGGLNIPAMRVVYKHELVDSWQAFEIIATEEDDTPTLFKRGIANNKEDKQSTPWIAVVKARSPKPLGVLAGASLILRWCEALRGECPRYVGSTQART